MVKLTYVMSRLRMQAPLHVCMVKGRTLVFLCFESGFLPHASPMDRMAQRTIQYTTQA